MLISLASTLAKFATEEQSIGGPLTPANQPVACASSQLISITGRRPLPWLEPREGGAETVVDAAAERDVPDVGAGDVQFAGLPELCGVMVGGPNKRSHPRARLHGRASHLRVLQGNPPVHLHRRIVAQKLLDGRTGEFRAIAQECELLRVIEQRPDPVADQVGGGLILRRV